MIGRRVVVTGLGIVSPVGNTTDSAWQSIREGRSGIQPIQRFDTTPFAVRFGGEVRDFDVTQYLSRKEARKMDPFIHYGIAAAVDALRDSGLTIDSENADRVGVSVGSGIGGIHSIEEGHKTYLESGPRRISPFFIPSAIINMVSGNLSILLGAKGPNVATVTACTSATHNLDQSARMIAYGDADAMIAGGAEFSTTPTGLGGFAAARALSTRNDDPQGASRPWDQGRDGFVLGDGAAVLILEEYEQARRRGAPIYAEIAGFGMSGDAHHMTLPAETGEGAQRCMDRALEDAGMNPDEIHYVNAHGTSTQAGDRAELRAVQGTFGEHARRLPVSSTKSMTGHLLGAAGGVEAVFTLLAMRDGILPPTINLETPDEDLDMDLVPNVARDQPIRAALSNSFGFGGTNGTVIFRALDA
ncbi:beta-ketoacyl-ACP synthase II [Spiribacter roseus]|uniref:beta-ketoacyl-ACP synthase II n=1 Tax=Spiribacter roseus TaxID=1855875 RepID=UPI00132F56A3|nr:beta-ketoacyl-ACP synthase II [Spiribacter roseus]KAF0281299.1 beta-ketoacyl-[acyl-carrier-protein] synthase II [Spiribacter roseus]